MEPSLSLGHKKQVAKSRRREVDALLAGDLLRVVSVTVAEVALLAAISTDCAGIVFADITHHDHPRSRLRAFLQIPPDDLPLRPVKDVTARGLRDLDRFGHLRERALAWRVVVSLLERDL